VAVGRNGAVTVAGNGLAARAGLKALKKGGSAIDGAMTTALAQVALTAGAPISYFGIMSLVYYDAASGKVSTMNAQELWERMKKGAVPFHMAEGPKHSDNVVCIDKAGKPVLGFASMGSGLHQRTFQCLFGFMRFGWTVDQAIDSPDFFAPTVDPKTTLGIVNVPKGRFPEAVLKGMGYAYEEIVPGEARVTGEGLWVAISRDPKTGDLRAASSNRHNSAAVAY